MAANEFFLFIFFIVGTTWITLAEEAIPPNTPTVQHVILQCDDYTDQMVKHGHPKYWQLPNGQMKSGFDIEVDRETFALNVTALEKVQFGSYFCIINNGTHSHIVSHTYPANKESSCVQGSAGWWCTGGTVFCVLFVLVACALGGVLVAAIMLHKRDQKLLNDANSANEKYPDAKKPLTSSQPVDESDPSTSNGAAESNPAKEVHGKDKQDSKVDELELTNPNTKQRSPSTNVEVIDGASKAW